ncbi:hypothetical protein CO112_02585 [Candidatus Dojkabacteria bacterium CG_4_9_14_3_um_filter_150_Dojkabacteria_WS6_41_13]|uniref:Uncharacterized protein n=1 Tax=Candidatus Dojkabacteria bacterium CG_4_10_14_0_2_um_filter_Dojkabacteria_WS6_41_15 TaxID=2014249 RepID=A0A2M7W251_9BACT|nr:MAG: hypothetical protein COX64_03665 [Candidatus Dojkabacteria bacterium CG_4_10_14_0_2_um_filter_Dojkabacteria_WS6_41_15]PJB22773.1 MAG: hypothetical protein CO112_02585 [Candidatus Dojkabacteria bacterium CG_4_9_14_3_um_filter_150_Dojkabacteria_WS6_41_13]
MAEILTACREVLDAYRSGKLGQTEMPEDSNPGFTEEEIEQRYAYFSLPMALNYQRNSYTMWKSALQTYRDPDVTDVFDVVKVNKLSPAELQAKLTKHKLALQPNKHIATWRSIANTIVVNWGSFEALLKASEFDFVQLRSLVQEKYKKGFPYLSGPKIFNYWSFILNQYCGANLKNSDLIEIAPDTHVIKCSVLLGVITKTEAETMERQEISEKWRNILQGSGIKPIDMHPVLWFWSRNGFIYKPAGVFDVCSAHFFQTR